jgi:ABC-2 type transport system permease protein
MNLNPILYRELRTQLRGVRSTVLISTFVGLLIAALIFMYRTISARAGLGTPLLNAQIGQALFSGLALLLQTLVVFIAPAITVSALSSEYEQRTLDFVIMTPLKAERILIGKIFAAICYLAVLLCSVLPLFSIVLLFGGVSVDDILRAAGVVLITAIFGITFGLFCSALIRRTAGATILCYTLLIALVGGTLFAASFWSITNSQQAASPRFVYLNPLSAMASALVGAPDPNPNITRQNTTRITPDTLQPMALVGVFSQGTYLPATSGPGVILIPVYRATAILYAIISLGLFWISAHLIPPKRGFHFKPIDIGLALLMIGLLVLAYLWSDWWFILPESA